MLWTTVFRPLLAALGATLLIGNAQAAAQTSRYLDDPYPSTYQSLASGPVLIQHATVLTGTGTPLDDADVLLRDGRIIAVGANLDAPAETLGVGDQLGSIAPGKRADLVLWSGDPLDISSVARQLWLGGNVIPMRSRQTELRDRYLHPANGLPRAYPETGR